MQVFRLDSLPALKTALATKEGPQFAPETLTEQCLAAKAGTP